MHNKFIQITYIKVKNYESSAAPLIALFVLPTSHIGDADGQSAQICAVATHSHTCRYFILFQVLLKHPKLVTWHLRQIYTITCCSRSLIFTACCSLLFRFKHEKNVRDRQSSAISCTDIDCSVLQHDNTIKTQLLRSFQKKSQGCLQIVLQDASSLKQ